MLVMKLPIVVEMISKYLAKTGFAILYNMLKKISTIIGMMIYLIGLIIGFSENLPTFKLINFLTKLIGPVNNCKNAASNAVKMLLNYYMYTKPININKLK